MNHLFGEIKEGKDKLKETLNERCSEENESSSISLQEQESARRKGAQRGSMTYEGNRDDYNYFGDDVHEVDIPLANK